MFSLANIHHLSHLLAILILDGSMCSECGHGTRKTSKNWARCKKCGTRMRRRTTEEASAELDRLIAEATKKADASSPTKRH